MAKESFFNSTIGKKIIVGLTGLFLISFLVVHVSINALLLLNDGGVTFNIASRFMAYNWLIRFMEIGLFAGFIIHIVSTLILYFQNRAKRPVGYIKSNSSANSKWYSRSMALLGTLILIFLVIHINQFWSHKLTEVYLGHTNADEFVASDPHQLVVSALSNPINLVIYIGAFIALAYHLLHGFSSAFQTLGLNHKKYTPIIKWLGAAFSIIVPGTFTIIALAIFFKWVQ